MWFFLVRGDFCLDFYLLMGDRYNQNWTSSYVEDPLKDKSTQAGL